MSMFILSKIIKYIPVIRQDKRSTNYWVIFLIFYIVTIGILNIIIINSIIINLSLLSN